MKNYFYKTLIYKMSIKRVILARGDKIIAWFGIMHR